MQAPGITGYQGLPLGQQLTAASRVMHAMTPAVVTVELPTIQRFACSYDFELPDIGLGVDIRTFEEITKPSFVLALRPHFDGLLEQISDADQVLLHAAENDMYGVDISQSVELGLVSAHLADDYLMVMKEGLSQYLQETSRDCYGPHPAYQAKTFLPRMGIYGMGLGFSYRGGEAFLGNSLLGTSLFLGSIVLVEAVAFLMDAHLQSISERRQRVRSLLPGTPQDLVRTVRAQQQILRERRWRHGDDLRGISKAPTIAEQRMHALREQSGATVQIVRGIDDLTLAREPVKYVVVQLPTGLREWRLARPSVQHREMVLHKQGECLVGAGCMLLTRNDSTLVLDGNSGVFETRERGVLIDPLSGEGYEAAPAAGLLPVIAFVKELLGEGLLIHVENVKLWKRTRLSQDISFNSLPDLNKYSA